MSDTPIFDATPPTVNPSQQDDLETQVERMVQARLDQVEAKYAQRVQQLEEQLAAATIRPATSVPEHAGGPGLNLAPTWGMMHQELSRMGQLTEPILRDVGLAADVIAKVL